MTFRPSTYDFLRPNGFVLAIDNIPNFNYNCQGVSFPGISLGSPAQETPFIDVNHVGEKLNYTTLNVRAIVSEDMQNYIEIVEWMRGLGFPESHADFEAFIRNRMSEQDMNLKSRFETETSPGSLFVLNSANNPIVEWRFENLFPINASGMEYDTTTSMVEYLTMDVVFLFTDMKVNSLLV